MLTDTDFSKAEEFGKEFFFQVGEFGNSNAIDKMCDSRNVMMHQFSAENFYTYPTENSQFGPERGYRKIRPIIAGNAARERSRVKTLRTAFLELQRTLPAVPPDTKLSKLDVLVLATTYIAHLMRTLNEGVDDNQLFAANGIMHPVKVF